MTVFPVKFVFFHVFDMHLSRSLDYFAVQLNEGNLFWLEKGELLLNRCIVAIHYSPIHLLPAAASIINFPADQKSFKKKTFPIVPQIPKPCLRSRRLD